MKKYYLEIINKEEDCNYMFQSKWFKSPRQVEKWLATNIDYIAFNNYWVDIKYAEFDESGNFGDIYRYSYIDTMIFENLKLKYKGGNK